mgnify:CR=1 FL=1
MGGLIFPRYIVISQTCISCDHMENHKPHIHELLIFIMPSSINKLTKTICENLDYHIRYGCYVHSISQDIYSTISFNIAHYGVIGHSYIAPRIGILHDRVETLLYKVSKMECYRRPNFPTISEHVGYILPYDRWMEWDFIEGGNCFLSKAADMQNTIQQSAAIFNSKYSDLNDIITYVEGLSFGSSNQELLIRLPIMYYLVGKKDKGLLYIHSICEKYSQNVLFNPVFMDNYNSL